MSFKIMGMVIYFFVSGILVHQFDLNRHPTSGRPFLAPILAILFPIVAGILFPLWYAFFLAGTFIPSVFGVDPRLPYYFKSPFQKKFGILCDYLGIAFYVAAVGLFLYDAAKFFHLF